MANLRGYELLIIVLVVVLLFGAKRLPDAARSVGRSLRIFKAETKALADAEPSQAGPGQPGPSQAESRAVESRAVESRAVDPRVGEPAAQTPPGQQPLPGPDPAPPTQT